MDFCKVFRENNFQIREFLNINFTKFRELLLRFFAKSAKLLLMITTENKATAVAKVTTATNIGSPEAQVAILTARINELTEHMKTHAHDFAARVGLLRLVGKRKKLLARLEKTDFTAYKKVIAKLGLRK